MQLLQSFPVSAIIILALNSSWQFVRSDPVEGSRLLEEAFRDYDKRIRPNFAGSPVTVNVSMHILSVPEIDTNKMTYKISFYIRQTWMDSRLSFNSRRNIDTITLDGTTAERIWFPDTYFVNELNSVNHNILVKNQFCRISQDGLVQFSRKVTLTAFSQMAAMLFPYDAQQLVLKMESYGSQVKDLKYRFVSPITHSSDMRIPGFEIDNIATKELSETTETGSYSRLILELNVKRNPVSFELGILLPTSLLTLLCLATLQMKEHCLGLIMNAFIITAMIILYGKVLLNHAGDYGEIPCFTPLHLYVLVSLCFSFACLILNLRRDTQTERRPTDFEECVESKSRTESTSEDIKVEGLKSDAVVASLEGKDRKHSKCKEGDKKIWERIMHRLRKGSKCDRFMQAILWTSYALAVSVFFVVFHFLRLL